MSKSKIHESNSRLDYELSEIIVSFKDLIHKIEFADVYTGEEKIPFSEKEAEFREILLSEFLT
ncbi:MAG: hypothetical protein ACFFFY_03610 [Promethearchaeota archaeon]